MKRVLFFPVVLTSVAVLFLGCPDKNRGGGSETPPTAGGPEVLPLTGNARSGDSLAADALSEEQRAAREKAEAAAATERWQKRLATFKLEPADLLFARGETEEAKQNHKAAADAFTAFVVHHLTDARMPVALRRAMRGRFALNEFTEGLNLVRDSVRQTKVRPTEARIERMLGNTYLAIPHWGVTRGGEFLRAQRGQGQSTQSYREDRARAVLHLERARILMAEIALPHEDLKQGTGKKTLPDPSERKSPEKKLPVKEPVQAPAQGLPSEDTSASASASAEPQKPTTVAAPISDDERVEALFELIAAIARFTPYDGQWNYWWYGWAASESDGLANEEGEDERAGRRGRHYSWNQELYSARPRGLPVTPAGKVVFAKRPLTYAPGLEDVAKIKFLLEELRTTDRSHAKNASARSLLMQALLFRARDGVERLDRLRNYWWQGSYPFKGDLEKRTLFDLQDDEVLALVATHLQTISLPPDESVPQILTRLEEGYPKTDAADEGVFLLGQFFQTRQQYRRARAVYQRYLETRPQGSRRGQVQSALNELDRKEVAVVWSGAQPAGRAASVNLRFRNLSKVELRIRPVDQEAILRDFKARYKNGTVENGAVKSNRGGSIQPGNLGYSLVHDYDGAVKKYANKVSRKVVRTLTPNADGRYADQTVDLAVSAPGTYLVDVFATGKDAKNFGTRLGRGLVVVEALAMVQKRDRKGALIWIVDALTGDPVSGARIERFEYWNTYKTRRSIRHSKTSKARSDRQGLARGASSNYQMITTVRKGKAVTYVGWSFYYGNYRSNRQTENATVALAMTDRPVYRPGDKVSVKVWARQKKEGVYEPAAGVKSINVVVRDAQSTQIFSDTLKTDGWGSGHFQFPLLEDAALGMYSMTVSVDGRSAQAGGAQFRVEEYKAPEFTVNVKAAGQARLGDKIKAEVQADYLFGGGVAGGKVSYKVYRQDHEHTMLAPGPWDWLYGAGYGRCYYAYGWFDWWGYAGPRPWVWYSWWGTKPESPRELIKEGEGVLDEHGRLQIEIDTAPAKKQRGKSDHRYTVTAEVTDLSRRLIKGEGSITVTRNAFFASIENEAGYWWANQSVTLAITTQLPDGQPLSTKGKVVIEEVAFVGESGATVTHQQVETIALETNKLGATRVTWRPSKTGQFKFTFVAKDSWGTEVRKSTVAWVVGPNWNGRQYRFNGLEVLTDKRVYKVGEKAKLLVNVNRKGASVLLATNVDQGTLLDYRVLKIEGKSTIIEVPITKAHVPNFFVEATTVAEGTLFQEAREIFVPPQNSELNVEVTSNKDEYKPGEAAELTIKTTDLAGNPVPADVALSIFDTSVLYIQSDLTPDVRQHFWARKRTHSIYSQSSLTRSVNWGEGLSHPDRQAYWRLRSASSRYFQNEINWRDGGADGQLKGGQDLAKTMSEANKDARSDSLNEKLSGRKEERAAPGRSREAKKKSRRAPASPAARQSRALGKSSAMAEEEMDDDSDDLSASGLGMRGVASGAGGMGIERDKAGAKKKKKPRVRKNFADTAHFSPQVRTGDDGIARLSFKFPDNLTTWKVKAIGMAKDTRAGQSSTTLLTTKKLLVRLQAPRFFRERDRVVLSAIVHNKYKKAKQVDVSIDVSEGLLAVEGKKKRAVTVPAGGEKRVDFWVEVKGEGMARVRMDALGDVESDAKEMSFPVLVHGMTKTVSSVGSIAANGETEKTIVLDIPHERREELSRLQIRFSPTLAGGMMDALPYLLDYPYGCTEQTLSRFVPAVLTRRALQQAGGMKLEDLASKDKKNLNPQQLTAAGKPDAQRLAREQKRMQRSPVFDTKTLNSIIRAGLKRLQEMQNSDGGWGWWGSDGSSRYTTAHVLGGLLDAQEADLAFDRNMLGRGKNALARLVQQGLWRYDRHQWVGNDDAYAAWVMSRYQQKNEKLLDYLWQRREKLSAYGKILAAMAFFKVDDKKKAQTLFENAEQILENDNENETSWLETRKEGGGWWYWYNDAVETNALYLRALDTMHRGSKKAPRVVKWLLNNRAGGYYWRSTRDTATVVAAFANHMQKSDERRPDYDLEILIDGKVMKTVHIDKTNLFTFDNELVLEGKELTSGKHKLTFRKKGKGAVYFNTYLSYFTTEEDVKKAGLEIKVDRQYYKLERRDRKHKVQGDRGQSLVSTEVAYQKIPLATGAKVQSGDLILVELMLTSKNDYTFLAFEDPKPAGAEPVALRSGTTYGEAVANMELRDEKVVFFLRKLSRGKLKLSYRLRAEIPGEFHAMPTFGFGMYAPELKANSDEMRLVIEEATE